LAPAFFVEADQHLYKGRHVEALAALAQNIAHSAGLQAASARGCLRRSSGDTEKPPPS